MASKPTYRTNRARLRRKARQVKPIETRLLQGFDAARTGLTGNERSDDRSQRFKFSRRIFDEPNHPERDA